MAATAASKVGFIGLGNMGSHMARNLLGAGHKLVVHDSVAVSQHELESAGAVGVTSPAAVAAECDTVVTMLPAGPHVRSVYCGKNGILSSVRKDALLLDASTIDIDSCKSVAAAAQQAGAIYMDAPVSGGVNAAKNAGLTFMVGGPNFTEAESVLQHMGKRLFHCGDVGTGQAAKICNNMMLAISMIGTSETINLGTKLGLDPKLLSEILSTSSGRTWSVDTYNPCPGVMEGVPSSNNYNGGFGTALMAKDLGLAQDAATHNHSATPLGSLAHQIYRMMVAHNMGTKDFSSVFQFLKHNKQQ